jgi:hypothetical protein
LEVRERGVSDDGLLGLLLDCGGRHLG